MRILNLQTAPKPALPKGKVTVRWVKSRNAYQVYVGGRYLLAASGDYPEDAIEAMRQGYDCPPENN